MDAKCDFCDRNELGERIIAEDDYFYIVATFGQISDGGYVIIIPKTHIPCMGRLRKPELYNISPLLDRVSRAITAEYGCAPLIFEHGVVGQTIKHAHVHLVPTKRSITLRIYKDFPNSKINGVREWRELVNMYSSHPEPYLLWREYNSEILSICHSPSAPTQYLRVILAETMGRPERANWRNMDRKLDKRLCTETVLRLKPYFK
jgi:diadenosine tetraphosphate (Ap4A) HIT family hydrolase